MSPLRMPATSLIAKLALFYGTLSLVALLLVRSTVLLVEYRELVSSLEAGLMVGAVSEAAEGLSGDASLFEQPETRPALQHALEALLLRLERPHGGRTAEMANVLAELARQPLAARIVGPMGAPIASAPADGTWQLDLPPEPDPAWFRPRAQDGAMLIASTDTPSLVRRYMAPLHNHDGVLLGALFVELRLPTLWRSLLQSGTFEWPILLAYLAIFSIGSAWFLSRHVTRRLRRIGAAASAWGRGELGSAIHDHAQDELGRLARDLDRMAIDLRALVQTRGQLAMLEERHRLARDLHDTVKQKAFALNLQLSTAARLLGAGATPVAARIEEARHITEEIQSELGQLLAELRMPEPVVDFAGLLATRCADFSRRSGILLELNDEAAHTLDASQQQVVLRIADEALANVWRHSGARRVSVDLVPDERGFLLRIEDNGRGGARERGRGMGIANMRERAAELPGGKLSLGDAPGGGTRVTVSWEHLRGDER